MLLTKKILIDRLTAILNANLSLQQLDKLVNSVNDSCSLEASSFESIISETKVSGSRKKDSNKNFYFAGCLNPFDYQEKFKKIDETILVFNKSSHHSDKFSNSSLNISKFHQSDSSGDDIYSTEYDFSEISNKYNENFIAETRLNYKPDLFLSNYYEYLNRIYSMLGEFLDNYQRELFKIDYSNVVMNCKFDKESCRFINTSNTPSSICLNQHWGLDKPIIKQTMNPSKIENFSSTISPDLDVGEKKLYIIYLQEWEIDLLIDQNIALALTRKLNDIFVYCKIDLKKRKIYIETPPSRLGIVQSIYNSIICA